MKIGDKRVTALFFADNLVLISGRSKIEMNKLLRVVCMFCRDMKMTLATSKTYIISNATYDVNWSVDSETIEEILFAKYLGLKYS